MSLLNDEAETYWILLLDIVHRPTASTGWCVGLGTRVAHAHPELGELRAALVLQGVVTGD